MSRRANIKSQKLSDSTTKLDLVCSCFMLVKKVFSMLNCKSSYLDHYIKSYPFIKEVECRQKAKPTPAPTGSALKTMGHDKMSYAIILLCAMYIG